MTGGIIIALALSGLWLLAAVVLPLLDLRSRHIATWLLVIFGVPLLGWLTLHYGPSAGVLGFLLGTLILLRPVLRRPSPQRKSRA